MITLEITGTDGTSFDQQVTSVLIPSVTFEEVRVCTKLGVASIVNSYKHNPISLIADADVIDAIVDVSPCRIVFDTGTTIFTLEHCYITENNKDIIYKSCIMIPPYTAN